MNSKPEPGGFWEGVSLALTNVAKTVGVIAAANELLFEQNSDPKRLAFIAVLLTGTQAVENFLRGVFQTPKAGQK